VGEEAPPDPIPKRRKRKASRDAEITVRDFGPGAKLFARYTLSRILGRGGMGIVWLAHDHELDRQVALKFLSQQIIHDHSVLADLKRETKRSLELTHPNIVRIHDFVQDARSACISMEFVDGQTLSKVRVTKTNLVFEVPDLEPLVAQWCEAMHYAHVHARVVHCDLKPANLMLNAKGLLKITDFGIARSLSESASKLTVSRSNSGTLVYMSPQQLNGDPVSVLDDIYSMGATLYELLTGKPPFYRGQIDLQIFDKIPPSVTTRRDELGVKSPFIIPLQWEDAIAACLSKEPVGRPQGALALLNRLHLTSPLRQEAPRIVPHTKQAVEPPLVPGTFGLMQDEPDARLGSVPAAERGGESTPKRPIDSKNERIGAEASAPAALAGQSVTAEQPVLLDNRQPGRRLSDRVYPVNRRYVVPISLTLLGAALIIGLWYLLSSLLRNNAKTTSRTDLKTLPTAFAATPTPNQISPRPDQRATARKTTPTVSASETPDKKADVTPTPVEATTSTPSTEHEEKRAIVPKDDPTRFRNEVAAAERGILSEHEKKGMQERLSTLTPHGRINYEKAVASLEEGYSNIAQLFVFEVARADGDNPLTDYLRGLVLLLEGKLDESESAFARATTLDPEFREAEYNLAAVAFKKKDYARARKRFEHLSSVIASPTEPLKQLLQYRIYLALLLEGAADTAQQLLQKMQANTATPAFYYAHAAWEFRRGDGTIAQQWVDSASSQYSHDLNVLFLKPLSDVGWLNPLSNIESTSIPSATPSAIPSATPDLQPLSLTEIALSQDKDPTAALHLSLRIGIAPKPNTPNGHSIDIRVSFFDLTSTGQTVPTDGRTSYRWVTSTRNWSEPTTKYLVATYVRPKTSTTAKTSRKYGGYVVRLYFDGHLQDERAAPTALLKAFPTDKQAMLLTPRVSPSASPQNSVQTSLTAAPSASISPATSDVATSTEAVNEISGLEDKWAVAILLHDAEAVQSLLADAYEAVTPTGRKWSKVQAVQRISDDTDKYDLVEIEHINVQVKNATSAVATGLLRQRGKFSRGNPFDRVYLFTDDWTKSDGKWLCTRSKTERAVKH
jgi:serine/threonine protein kinase/ketosteroid isomerase-like protein